MNRDEYLDDLLALAHEGQKLHSAATVYVDGVPAIQWCTTCGDASEWPCRERRMWNQVIRNVEAISVSHRGTP